MVLWIAGGMGLAVAAWAAHWQLTRREAQEGRAVWLDWDGGSVAADQPRPVPLGLRIVAATDAEAIETLIAETRLSCPRRSRR